MSELYEGLMEGLNEALEYAKGKRTARKRTIMVMPVKVYSADDVKRIRKKTGLPQVMFAEYLGVSHKTVEAWEAGRNHPSGAASRLLTLMELNENLTKEYPFVKIEEA